MVGDAQLRAAASGTHDHGALAERKTADQADGRPVAAALEGGCLVLASSFDTQPPGRPQPANRDERVAAADEVGTPGQDADGRIAAALEAPGGSATATHEEHNAYDGRDQAERSAERTLSRNTHHRNPPPHKNTCLRAQPYYDRGATGVACVALNEKRARGSPGRRPRFGSGRGPTRSLHRRQRASVPRGCSAR